LLVRYSSIGSTVARFFSASANHFTGPEECPLSPSRLLQSPKAMHTCGVGRIFTGFELMISTGGPIIKGKRRWESEM
jgi:hypothetical protein